MAIDGWCCLCLDRFMAEASEVSTWSLPKWSMISTGGCFVSGAIVSVSSILLT